ncbi:Predicted ATPase [Thermomonospora echinospora]|uniref:Predicted ATPase n=1 Tax=Thermomonospora echinospora TaxID=1992 RepID=A0A1H5ZXU9_9ACTN|nr:BTAD domain-containing putative transcriptional regulator [Thermomonospora echinospora]SEG40804.1 Predicted ATPase [Thermomonospora echinospora]
MRFGVLGPLSVWTDDGRLVTVPGLKVRALLADLLVYEGRPVPADRLIDDLWGQDPPSNPPAALSVKVSQLRRVLEDAEPGARSLVVSRPAGYLLQADDERVDARRFRALTARARETAEPAARAGALAEALALWRGPAFADFADEPFVQPVIARLEELRLAALEDHAEVRLALGEHGVLAAELGDLLAAHPLRERLRAAHMRALYRAGRQSEALDSYERLRAELADELGLDPGPELVALHRAILTQDPALDAPPAPAAPLAADASRPRTNLHAPATGLVGRDEAVAEISARLESDRLVTLTGPGGVGKTRLATETAGRLLGAFPDGVWMVELAAFEHPSAAELADAVLRVLDIRDSPGQSAAAPVGRLAEALAARRLLLVLDNCEHVVEQVADLAEPLLRAVPRLRVLATSREPLGLPGEVVWNVPPLTVPGRDAEPDPQTLAESGAVRLFVERASAAARGFRLDAENAAAVAVLCRRLDGIPLALELAATRVRALGVHGLVARLDDRFRLLATGQRGAPHRQRTLTAMIDWSWDLLAEPERAVLRRLAVHADGCSLEAAEAVCAGDDLPAQEVLDLLVRLVDRSLVVMDERSDEGPRYRLLESVAAYCADRMDEAGEHERVRLRHRRYYIEVAERAEPELYGHGQGRWLRLLDGEAANLRSAFDGAVASGDAEDALRLVNALSWYWFLRGRLAEARRSLAAALALRAAESSPVASRARAMAWHAGFAALQGDTADWAGRCDAALRLLEEAGDPVALARAQWFLAFTGSESADFTDNKHLLDRAMEGFRASGDRWGEAATLIQRALHAHSRGKTAVLRREAERAARLFGEAGDRWGQLQAAAWLGAHAELTGDHVRAERLQHEGLRRAEELRLWPDVAMLLGWIGWITMLRGDHTAARGHCERARRLALEHGHRHAFNLAEIGLSMAAIRQGELDVAEEHLQGLLKDIPQDGDADPPMHLTLVQIGLGLVAERRGDAASALALHRDALAVAIRYGAPRDTAGALEGAAGALSLAGRHAEAARMLGQAAAVRDSYGLTAGLVEREDIARVTGRIRAALPQDALDAEFERGAALSPADCLREAEAVRLTGPG